MIPLSVIRLAVALFAVQAGYSAFVASLPVALSDEGMGDSGIALIIGVASSARLPAALLASFLLPLLGSRKVFLAACSCYLAAALILAMPNMHLAAPTLPLVLARCLQGIGVALALPAALSSVTGIVAASARGFALGVVASAESAAIVVLPPVTLWLLSVWSIHAVAALAITLIVAGAVLSTGQLSHGVSAGEVHSPAREVSSRGLASRLGFRGAWFLPLAVVVLSIIPWGIIEAYVPQRAYAFGANVGLLFAADGFAVLALRVPSGWLADKLPRPLVTLSGLFITAAAVVLQYHRPTTALLIMTGLFAGTGAALTLTSVLVELSFRSTDAYHGAVFALYAAAKAAGLTLGSLGMVPVLGLGGFPTVLAVGLLALAGAGVCTTLMYHFGTPLRPSPPPGGP